MWKSKDPICPTSRTKKLLIMLLSREAPHGIKLDMDVLL